MNPLIRLMQITTICLFYVFACNSVRAHDLLVPKGGSCALHVGSKF